MSKCCRTKKASKENFNSEPGSNAKKSELSFLALASGSSKIFFKTFWNGGSAAILLSPFKGNELFQLARLDLLEAIPPKFEHQLHHHKQWYLTVTTAVLEKDENVFWPVLYCHRSCHRNAMTPLRNSRMTEFLDIGRFSRKSFTGACTSTSHLNVRKLWTNSMRALSRYFGMNLLALEIR